MMKQKIMHIDKRSDRTKTLVALPTWATPKVFRWGLLPQHVLRAKRVVYFSCLHPAHPSKLSWI